MSQIIPVAGASQADFDVLSQDVDVLENKIKTIHTKVAKADCSYTYDGVSFIRSGNVVYVRINGVVSLPGGAYIDICTIPEGYRTTDSFFTDIVCGSDNVGSNLRTLRLRLDANNKLRVYNYGSQLSNNNLNPTGTFVVY